MIQYRQATIYDLELLVSIRKRDMMMFSSTPLTDEVISNIRNFYQEKLENNEILTLLGYDKDILIATATIYYYHILPSCSLPRGLVGQISNIWVDDQYRRQGIASMMIKYLEDHSDVDMLCLNSSTNELYEKLGYELKDNYFVKYK
ncbi:MAG: GNAT family N-acetyltransferase [Erysipelotrichaceae bacterium]|nr:GNAT family N-acetyltransferase [Erysipelotrichaceae bacterium]